MLKFGSRSGREGKENVNLLIIRRDHCPGGPQEGSVKRATGSSLHPPPSFLSYSWLRVWDMVHVPRWPVVTTELR